MSAGAASGPKTDAARARVAFMGTAAFAVPSLRALADAEWAELATVVTQPARAAGRGRAERASPVGEAAVALGLPVFTPERLRRPEAVEALRALAPDLVVVAAYGQILSPQVLAIPRHGSLNVHASLLPRYRGAAPIVGALLAGEAESGVTIMLMDAGLDTGPILSQIATPIGAQETAAALGERLAALGADLLLRTAPDWLAGRLTPRPQDDSLASLTRPLRKEEGRIDWSRPALAIERAVRAYDPWPGAFGLLGPAVAGEGADAARGDAAAVAGERLVIRAARAWPTTPGPAPGIGGEHERRPVVGTGAGVLEPLLVQPAGRRPMGYADYLRGRRLAAEAVRWEVVP